MQLLHTFCLVTWFYDLIGQTRLEGVDRGTATCSKYDNDFGKAGKHSTFGKHGKHSTFGKTQHVRETQHVLIVGMTMFIINRNGEN